MSDIDRGQTPAGSGDPIGQLRRLGVRQKRIDQQGFPLAVDQRRGVRHPFQVILAGGDSLGCARAFPDEKFPFEGLGHHRTVNLETFPRI